MRRVKSLERLYDFIATVVVCAPDRFPKEDFLPEQDQLTLDRAFEELNFGMQFVREEIEDEAELERLQRVLDESLAAYRAGDVVKAAHLLNEFEVGVFKRKKASVTPIRR
jgi:hypothetical protein